MVSRTRVVFGRAAMLVLAWSALSHLRLGLPDFDTFARAAGSLAPGGFVEKSNSTVARPRLSAATIAAILPARGSFSFPAPYGTEAARLTNSSDCGGGDCVNSVGYSYWNNMNNSAGSNTLYAFVVLARGRGGSGPNLFSYDKTTGIVTKLGPMFASTSPYASNSGEGWYFSSTMPNTLYVFRAMTLQRYDVVTHALTTVFDATAQFGPGLTIWQIHSSHDDKVHSATLRSSTQWDLGCFAYFQDSGTYKYYPRVGTGAYDECQIDASGRWLQIKEDVDGVSGVDNRIIDLQTGVERRHPWQSGAPGHSDNGYGYTVGEDAWNNLPNAFRVYPFDQDSWASAPVVYNNMDWSVVAPAHVSHANARPGVPLSQQYACGSGANRSNTSRANEVECFRLDQSLDVLVVAPVMTDLDAAGGTTDDYQQMPKGNLDPTGQYFMWTTNLGTARQDAFIVRVPSHLLVAGSGDIATGPSLSGIGASAVDGVSALVNWTTSIPADSQVDYGLSTAYGGTTVRNAAYVTSHSQPLSGLSAGTMYHYRVRSRDAAGNQALSADQTFQTADNPNLGMSACWALDESAGTAFADATGTGHGGTLVNGPVHVAGRTGLAVAFDGIDDTATVPHDAAFDSYPLSLSFWMRSTSAGLSGIVNKYLVSSRNGYQVFTSGGALCGWYFRDAANYVWDGTGCSLQVTGVNDGAWHHVAMVVDAAGGRIYVDGTQRASRAWTGTPGPATTTQPVSFATYPGTAGPPLSGALDDVRLYSRGLSATEVRLLSQVQRDTTPPDIRNVKAVSGRATSALIAWRTEEPSDTQVDWGTTTGYGHTSPLEATLVQPHYVTLTGLIGNTTYHFRARSKDVAGNQAVSGDFVFVTPPDGVLPLQPTGDGVIPPPTGGETLPDGVIPVQSGSAATLPSSAM
jgi:hypothetical protein